MIWGSLEQPKGPNHPQKVECRVSISGITMIWGSIPPPPSTTVPRTLLGMWGVGFWGGGLGSLSRWYRSRMGLGA